MGNREANHKVGKLFVFCDLYVFCGGLRTDNLSHSSGSTAPSMG